MSIDEDVNTKANFGSIYDQRDPRAYFNTLAEFDYRVPQDGADVFRQLLTSRTSPGGHTPTALDVCCSYGIVSTLLKSDLTIDEIYRHYDSPTVRSMSVDEVTAADRDLLSRRLVPEAPRVVGLDVANNAIDYAVAIGSLDAGAAENLEERDPSPRLKELLRDVDLITTTGGIGYITDRTFKRLLDAVGPQTHVASFCLRTYDYQPIADLLAENGLVTETADRTFRQRRFADAAEHNWARDRVRERNLDPSRKEDSGYFHAEFHLSRPATEVKAAPLADLLPTLSEHR